MTPGPASLPLTRRQKQVLEFLRTTLRTRGYPPSLREIGQALGLASASTVRRHLDSLQQRGLVRRDRFKPRTIEVVEADSVTRSVHPVPLVQDPEKDLPSLDEGEARDVWLLPRALGGGPGSFLLRMRGEGMKEAGVLDGDYLVVERSEDARDGETVVARVDGEITVRRLFHESTYKRLEPANHRMTPIFARRVFILGRVVAVLRRLP